MSKIELAILTPTWNRAKLLSRLFESLQKQVDNNFIWYVVDDGSKDNTADVIEEFKKRANFEIKYYKKENGGKHTALNFGVEKIKEKFTFIVDSDDMLTPTAVQTIYEDMPKVEADSFCGMAYLRGVNDKEQIGKKFKKDLYADTFINARYNKSATGDKAEVFKTSALKEFKFPVFEGEIFISEASVWVKMSGPYKFLFINKIIYIGEYQPGGLTDNARRLNYNNPKGAAYCYKVLSGKGFNLKNKIKHTLLFEVHALACGMKRKEIIKESNNKFLAWLLYLPAKIIYRKRKKQYEK